jgi:hypothetical protein
VATTDPKLQFPPLLNGLDYIESVVADLAGEPTAKDLKYAVLHLHGAVEVLLKVRLMREHWTLVFKDANKASFASLQGGDFASISVEDTIKRLESVASITLPKDVVDNFSRLGKVRNKLTHFGLTDSALSIEALASEVLNGLLDFLRAHLHSDGSFPDDDAALAKTEELISDELHRLRGVIVARLKQIEPELTKREGAGESVVTCPSCQQEALVIGTNERECLFCHRDCHDAEKLAAEFGSEVLGISRHDVAEGVLEPVSTCWECGTVALVAEAELRGQLVPKWLCFECGVTAESDEVGNCSICNEPMIMNEGTGTACASCFSDKVNAGD